MESRQQLRASIRKRRNLLTAEQQTEAAELLKNNALKLIQSGQSIALYLTNDGEVNTAPLIEHLRELDTPLLFPVLHSFCSGYLNFQYVNRQTNWTTNKYGITEPAPNALTTAHLSNIDIIFMPLVAFDTNGNRLGMGGGYYDRTLANINQLSKKPTLVGLAHDCQEVEHLNSEQWDIPINMIVTPTRIIRI
ncbi:5-formyltetrahydrofolate cyclo-ligase [Psychrosphaera haliotis]|uniref:5-formyltetrahydrofolate cyclo-ligase n=1 Tax=Psychrosphaera haliotis TaxID=555083 RepID=A0A6N8F491_9GAMM|nr:5-formyltetrahydrofolate cyclo-ligase [Psychrosphaera haliotis]MUH71486.1 5-formyltetrahydrofolate cyclo-ligase [Psychrosphaera haliotis]